MARSVSVRIGVVTGMPLCVVLSGFVVVCRTTPLGALRPPRVVVTWMRPAGLGRISHSAAAVVWLNIAFGPQARTAASQWPSVRSTLWPSAYTPR